MKKVFLFTVLSLCSAVVFAQFAIVSDKDGYVNVRSSPEIKKDNIIDTLHNGSLVYVMEDLNKENWKNIDFKGRLNGYVYENRIKYISDYQIIPQIFTNYLSSPYEFNDSVGKIIFSNKTIEVEIKTRKFDSSKHTITYAHDGGEWVFVYKIDGKNYWGSDGIIPEYEYEYISITINDSKYFLPNKAIKNLFAPNFYWTKANYDKENDILYIQSMNGDGAYGYVVAWKIEKGIYKERLIIYGF